MSGIECPLCIRVDMVQKVTAIVEGETNQTSGYSTTINKSSISGQQDYYGRQDGYAGRGELSGAIHSQSSTNISATQQSRLAQKLRPPSKPTQPAEPDFSTSIFSGLPENVNTGLFIVAWILAGMLLFSVFSDVRNSSVTGILMFCVGAPILVGVFVMTLETLWNRVQFPTDRKEKMLAIYQKELHTFAQFSLPKWEEAMNRWNSMYYCRRCDVIYIPGDSVKPQSPDKTLDLCFHGTK